MNKKGFILPLSIMAISAVLVALFIWFSVRSEEEEDITGNTEAINGYRATVSSEAVKSLDKIVEDTAGPEMAKYFSFSSDHSVYWYKGWSNCQAEDACLEENMKYRKGPYYQVYYELNYPGEGIEGADFLLETDDEFNVKINDIPDCVRGASICDFPIKKTRAIEIARERGLAEGISEWKTYFFYDRGNDIYVWQVSNDFGDASEIPGQNARINALTGELIKISNQYIIE